MSKPDKKTINRVMRVGIIVVSIGVLSGCHALLRHHGYHGGHHGYHGGGYHGGHHGYHFWGHGGRNIKGKHH